MNSEKRLISLIAKNLPRSNRQVNALFESDSEILRTENGNLLFSVDDYTEEDHFRTGNPYNLGWNLAVATISDIFASGGIPAYFGHSMTIDPKKWDDRFVQEFSRGISDVLQNTDAYFIGGDFGFSDKWHYTGIVLGKSYRVLTRVGAKPGDAVFMTGTAGTGNMEAALTLFELDTPDMETKFGLRHNEAKLVARYATSCIDSSDGVVNALMTLSELNGTGFEITNTNLNKAASGVTELVKIPKELLLMGECGEYELLFTIKNEDLQNFLEDAMKRDLHFTRIGTVTLPRTKTISTDTLTVDLKNFNIRGRDFQDKKEYISALLKFLKDHGTANREGTKFAAGQFKN